MEPLTRKDVEDIALLARLRLTEDEVETLRVDLSAILVHMAELADIDTSGVEPMTQAIPMTLVMRDDVAQPSLSIDDAVGGAPDGEGSSFRVPNIIKTASGNG